MKKSINLLGAECSGRLWQIKYDLDAVRGLKPTPRPEFYGIGLAEFFMRWDREDD